MRYLKPLLLQWGRYLWMHNGVVGGFMTIRRAMLAALSDAAYNTVQVQIPYVRDSECSVYGASGYLYVDLEQAVLLSSSVSIALLGITCSMIFLGGVTI